jgi:hypothetical protein
MDSKDVDHPSRLGEFEALIEISRRLKVWASEVERPASYILDSLGDNLSRCATRLFLVSVDLAVSKQFAEERAQRKEVLSLVETLPSWTGPWYLETVARLAVRGDLFHRLDQWIGPVKVDG